LDQIKRWLSPSIPFGRPIQGGAGWKEEWKMDEKGTKQSSIKGADGVCLGGFATGGKWNEWKMVEERIVIEEENKRWKKKHFYSEKKKKDGRNPFEGQKKWIDPFRSWKKKFLEINLQLIKRTTTEKWGEFGWQNDCAIEWKKRVGNELIWGD
jgi:hypothetical protein